MARSYLGRSVYRQRKQKKRKLSKNLSNCLSQSKDFFYSLGEVLQTEHGPLIYIDNGADVLGVAHLDSVYESKPKLVGQRLYCPQLDDRLGVYVLLHMLPKYLGKPYDILLTDSEEKGRSTSQYFETTKQYNWMFQFDRAGQDVVMYQYERPSYIKMLEDADFEVGSGSFSDIAWLEHLGCAGFNFGVGYQEQHSYSCYADMAVTNWMVKKFSKFFQKHSTTYLVHEPVICEPEIYEGSYKSISYVKDSGQGYTKYDDGITESGNSENDRWYRDRWESHKKEDRWWEEYDRDRDQDEEFWTNTYLGRT